MPFALAELGLGARLGFTGLALALAGGLVASAAYVRVHHAPRDAAEAFSYDDLVGVYHGIDRPAPLALALERGHPEELGAEERATLLAWLASADLSADYDNLDLGDDSPAEVLERNCAACHARDAGVAVASELPLEFWDDVAGLARSYQVAPLPVEILLVTTHTHALALGSLGCVLALLVLATSFGRRAQGLAIGMLGVGLAVDLAAWWLAREHAAFVGAVVAGGALFALGAALALALVLLELWWPGRRRRPRGPLARG